MIRSSLPQLYKKDLYELNLPQKQGGLYSLSLNMKKQSSHHHSSQSTSIPIKMKRYSSSALGFSNDLNKSNDGKNNNFNEILDKTYKNYINKNRYNQSNNDNNINGDDQTVINNNQNNELPFNHHRYHRQFRFNRQQHSTNLKDNKIYPKLESLLLKDKIQKDIAVVYKARSSKANSNKDNGYFSLLNIKPKNTKPSIAQQMFVDENDQKIQSHHYSNQAQQKQTAEQIKPYKKRKSKSMFAKSTQKSSQLSQIHQSTVIDQNQDNPNTFKAIKQKVYQQVNIITKSLEIITTQRKQLESKLNLIKTTNENDIDQFCLQFMHRLSRLQRFMKQSRKQTSQSIKINKKQFDVLNEEYQDCKAILNDFVQSEGKLRFELVDG